MIPVSKRKTHVREEFVDHALLRFEYESNQREDWLETYEDDKKEIHAKLEAIDDLNLKENLEHVKYLAQLVEQQSQEITSLKAENAKVATLQQEISDLRAVNAQQSQQIAELSSLREAISALSSR